MKTHNNNEEKKIYMVVVVTTVLPMVEGGRGVVASGRRRRYDGAGSTVMLPLFVNDYIYVIKMIIKDGSWKKTMLSFFSYCFCSCYYCSCWFCFDSEMDWILVPRELWSRLGLVGVVMDFDEVWWFWLMLDVVVARCGIDGVGLKCGLKKK